MITADILEPPAERGDEALESMGSIVVPLMSEAWKRNGSFYGGKLFSLNAPALAQMWLSGDLKLFIAYTEDREPVGYLAGIVYRPLQYEARVFQITEWWSRVPEAEPVLFAAALNAMRFLGVPEAFATLRAGESLPKLPSRWKESGRQEQIRLVKE